jgi:hypothetical protein
MDVEATTLSRIGAWGQIVSIVLTVAFLIIGIAPGFVVTSVGYFIVTAIGVVGIRRAEGPLHLWHPLSFPGIVPFYYLGRSSKEDL